MSETLFLDETTLRSRPARQKVYMTFHKIMDI